MARLPQLAMAPSVSQPPCPARSVGVQPSLLQLLHSKQCSVVQKQQTVGWNLCGAAGSMHVRKAHLNLMCWSHEARSAPLKTCLHIPVLRSQTRAV